MPIYKYGKQKREMPKEEFFKLLEKGHFVKRMHKAFLVLLYYIGCRVSEVIELKKENFKVDKSVLMVDVKAKKHGIERAAFKLNTGLPYVTLIVERVERTRARRRVFPMCRGTAWLVVKRVAPKKYPHFFRLNRTVKFLNNPKVTLNEVRQWMAWKSLDTVNNYLGYSERTIGKLSDELD